jgi:hypothetical protein
MNSYLIQNDENNIDHPCQCSSCPYVYLHTKRNGIPGYKRAREVVDAAGMYYNEHGLPGAKRARAAVDMGFDAARMHYAKDYPNAMLELDDMREFMTKWRQERVRESQRFGGVSAELTGDALYVARQQFELEWMEARRRNERPRHVYSGPEQRKYILKLLGWVASGEEIEIEDIHGVITWTAAYERRSSLPAERSWDIFPISANDRRPGELQRNWDAGMGAELELGPHPNQIKPLDLWNARGIENTGKRLLGRAALATLLPMPWLLAGNER